MEAAIMSVRVDAVLFLMKNVGYLLKIELWHEFVGTF